jgi:hypothetical protein
MSDPQRKFLIENNVNEESVNSLCPPVSPALKPWTSMSHRLKLRKREKDRANTSSVYHRTQPFQKVLGRCDK